MGVQRIQNVFYVTDDMDRLQSFYEQALGLTLKFRDGERWSQFALGDGNFSLSSPDEAPEGAEGATVVFEVRDIDSRKDMIVAHGGSIVSERDMGSHGKTLAFVDPAGNLGHLLERAARADVTPNISATTFRTVMRQHASTVVLIATAVDGKVFGMPVTAFTPLSMEPPLVLFCVHRDSGTHTRLKLGTRVGISFLAHGQAAVSDHFAKKSKKESCEPPVVFGQSPAGAPIVPDACAAIEAVVSAQHPGGDHTIFVAEVKWASAADDGCPLLYHQGNYTASSGSIVC